nr:hypothetical protein [Bacilli bacterium]
MKKLLIILTSIFFISVSVVFYFKFRFKLEVTLSDDLYVKSGEEVNLKNYIIESNGIFKDSLVTFYEAGEKEVTLLYLDKYNNEREYSFKINVIDKDMPFILSSGSVTTYVGEEIDLLKGVICADYTSGNVTCIVEEEYDINEIGKYYLTYKATDESGNSATKNFTLNVIEKPKYTPYVEPSEPNYVYFNDVLETYKNDNTKIGIDVSRFQGDIDFTKIKEAGAEFVIIRLGWYIDEELGLDYNYEKYIEDATNAGLDIGLYFYSEARTKDEIDAIVKFIKDNVKHEIKMPIAYDWEDFKNYNSYKLSIYEFNNLAYRFMDGIKNIGYKSMLYGSKSYLTNMWIPSSYPVWVAQYYKEVTYTGDYDMWQLTEDGKIDGIAGTVDIDIFYIK